MSKVLVIGDLILDRYEFTTATRLCPEGPIPVLVPTGPKKVTRGGAGLVTDQLRVLIDQDNVIAMFGSKSIKKRIFADGRLVNRVDYDSVFVSNRYKYERGIVSAMKSGEVKMLIVSDYGKGALTLPVAERIMQAAKIMDIPVLVDAKNSWTFYRGAFAIFPNQRERVDAKVAAEYTQHVIQKLGADGCEVDGVQVSSLSEHPVSDTTGAGDVFLAAFATKLLELNSTQAGIVMPEELRNLVAAGFANKVAGISVSFTGTHVVTREEL